MTLQKLKETESTMLIKSNTEVIHDEILALKAHNDYLKKENALLSLKIESYDKSEVFHQGSDIDPMIVNNCLLNDKKSVYNIHVDSLQNKDIHKISISELETVYEHGELNQNVFKLDILTNDKVNSNLNNDTSVKDCSSIEDEVCLHVPQCVLRQPRPPPFP